MTSSPARWTTEELTDDAAISAAEFRADRLAISSAWESHYTHARKKFDLLLTTPAWRAARGRGAVR